MSQPSLEERGIPSLRGSSGTSNKLRLLIVAAVIIVMLAIIGFAVFRQFQAKRAQTDDLPVTEEQTQAKSDVHDTDVRDVPDYIRGIRDDTPPPPGASADAADLATSGGESADTGAGNTAGGNGIASHQGAEDAPSPEDDLRERRQRAPVAYEIPEDPTLKLTSSASSQPAQAEVDPYTAAMQAALNASTGVGSQQQDEQGSARLSDQLKADTYAAATATMGPLPSFTVAQGTIARCLLRTRFSSELAGFLSCQLSDPVYSADGRFVMAEAGSIVKGDYQTGQVKPGSTRAFVVWTEIRTPHNVRIPVDSPATDAMGRSGIAGRVNNHFWKRFGSGLLLSMVDDAVAMSSDQRFQNTTSSANDAAAIAVQNSVNIPPTISEKNGAIVNIFFARDLDFSSVYRAQLRRSVAPEGH